MSFVWVGMGFMTFFAASTLAIDVGMFMTARSQAQNAADAGALAGATALVFNDYYDRSAGGPVVRSAITTAESNLVIGNTVSVQTGDVTFPLGPTGLDNRVQVNVFRTTNRSNPVATLIGPMFGINTVDIGATATAEASPAERRRVREAVHRFQIAGKRTRFRPTGPLTDTTTRAISLPNADDATSPGHAWARDVWLLRRVAAKRRQRAAVDASCRHRQQHRAELLFLVGHAGRGESEATATGRTSPTAIRGSWVVGRTSRRSPETKWARRTRGSTI